MHAAAAGTILRPMTLTTPNPSRPRPLTETMIEPARDSQLCQVAALRRRSTPHRLVEHIGAATRTN